jgi:hypothetical protein
MFYPITPALPQTFPVYGYQQGFQGFQQSVPKPFMPCSYFQPQPMMMCPSYNFYPPRPQ